MTARTKEIEQRNKRKKSTNEAPSTAKKPSPKNKILALQRQLAAANQKLQAIENESEEDTRETCPGGEKKKTDLQLEIDKIIKNQLWNYQDIKFLQDDNEAAAVAKKIWRRLPTKVCKQLSFKAFLKTHKKYCLHSQNIQRQYCTSNLKKICDLWMDDHNNTLPEVADIEAIVNHTIDVENAENMALFMWWWEKVMVAVVGSKYEWTKIKYYDCLSTCKAQKSLHAPKDSLAVPHHTEAVAALFFENYRPHWLGLRAEKEANPGMDLAPMKKGDDKPLGVEGGTGRYKCLYTMCFSGQDPFGGWKKEGKDRYVQLRAIVEKARKKKGTKALEEKVLAQLRLKHKIEDEEPGPAKKKARKALKPAERVANLSTIVDSEEEDEGGEPASAERVSDSGTPDEDEEDGDNDEDDST